MKKLWILFVGLAVTSASGADMNCSKPEDLEHMVQEVLFQLRCSSSATIGECGRFLGVGEASGAALAAISARGLNRTMSSAATACITRRGAQFRWPEVIAAAHAADCVPDFRVATEEADRFLRDARRDLFFSLSEQDRQIQEQLRRTTEAADYYEHRGAPEGFRDWATSRRIDREYLQAVERVDRRHMPQIISRFEELIAGSDAALRERGSELLTKLRTASATPGNMQAYAHLDDLMDLYNIRRPVDRNLLSRAANPLVTAVESATQERILDLSDQKRLAYQRLAEITPPNANGQLFLEYSPIERYELERMKSMSVQVHTPAYPTPTVTPAPGALPDIERTSFTQRGVSAIESRFPLMMEDPRIASEVTQLRHQTWRMAELTSAFNGAQISLRDLKGGTANMAEVSRVMRGLPPMPEGSGLAVERQILAERFKNLEAGKGWTLTDDAIRRFGLQEAAAGGAKFLARRGVSLIARAGILIAGPIGAAAAWADTAHSTIGMVLPDSVNCQTPCSQYLNYDETCNARPVLNDKSQAFLRLNTNQQAAEIAKCPAMCDQLKGLYAQASPVVQWRVQCSTGEGPTAFTLRPRDPSKSSSISVVQGEPTRIRFEHVSGLGPAQMILLSRDEVTSVRVARRGGNPSPEAIARRMALEDSNHFHVVTPAEVSRPSSWFQRDAGEAQNFLRSIQFALAESRACCGAARGEFPLGQVPGAKRCQDYGVTLPETATRGDSLRVVPAAGQRD